MKKEEEEIENARYKLGFAKKCCNELDGLTDYTAELKFHLSPLKRSRKKIDAALSLLDAGIREAYDAVAGLKVKEPVSPEYKKVNCCYNCNRLVTEHAGPGSIIELCDLTDSEVNPGFVCKHWREG